MYRKISPILFGFLLIPFFIFHGFYLRLWAMPMRYLYPPIGIHVINHIVRFWGVNFMRLGAFLNRVKFKVSGFEPEPGKPYLILSNHQSIIDIVVLFWIFRKQHIKFVMKKELRWGIPNISPATRSAKFAFLDRKAGVKPAERVLGDFANVVREEQTGCVIFPEGTRSRDGQLRSFKSAGVGLLAERLDYEILVITLDGTWRAATPNDIYHNLPHMVIHAHIEKPLPPEPFRKDLKGEMDKVRATMAAQLEKFRSAPAA